MNVIEHYWTLLNAVNVIERYWALWTLLNSFEHYWTLLNAIEHYWTLLNTIEAVERHWTPLNTIEHHGNRLYGFYGALEQIVGVGEWTNMITRAPAVLKIYFPGLGHAKIFF